MTDAPPPEFESRILDAIRRGASMEDIAGIRPSRVDTPAEAIRALKEGNSRFFGGQSLRPDLGANERRAQIMGQTPFAVVLACSDSRVPVELVFDQGFGDLFVVRVAGNVMADSALGTVEYAIRHLKVQLIMVMGHEGCGAVLDKINNPCVNFPTIVHPQCLTGDPGNQFGKGCIITAGVILTIGIHLADFVIINLSSTVGHDVHIKRFSTVMPGCNISGNVKIGEGCMIGTGAKILQNLSIGNHSHVGAGAVVTHNFSENKTIIGIPAHEK